MSSSTMASNVSPANSPLAFDGLQSDDESWGFVEMPPGSSNAGSSIAFMPSPASRSLASYGVVTHVRGHRGPSPSLSSLSMSPGQLHSPGQVPLQIPPTSSPAQPTSASPPSLFTTSDHPTSYPMQFTNPLITALGMPTTLGTPSVADSQLLADMPTELSNQLLQSPDLLLSDQQIRDLLPLFTTEAQSQAPALHSLYATLEQQQQQQRQQQPQSQQPIILDIPAQLQSVADVPPWNPTSVPEQGATQMFAMDEYGIGSASPSASYMSAAVSPSHSASPRSPANIRIEQIGGFGTQQQPALPVLGQLGVQQLQQFMQQDEQLQQLQQLQQQQQQIQQFQQLHQIQQQQQQQQQVATPVPPHQQPIQLQFQVQNQAQFQQQLQPRSVTSAPSATTTAKTTSKPTPARSIPTGINKVRGTGTRVAKRRSTNNSAVADKILLNANFNSSNSSLSSSQGSNADDKFVIVTPTTINAFSGSSNRHNPFECFEAMNDNKKGRKGPLADEIKESALQVRRVGACFCCHARKVRCDAHRPCKNCTKLATAVPQVVCWRFDDFLVHLFPPFIREHFRKDEMAKYISQSIASFTVNGAEIPCTVRLSSGATFKSTLEIRGAKFFTPKTTEILHHGHLITNESQVQLEIKMSAPIGLDVTEGSGATAAQHHERLKKTCRNYIDNLVNEKNYVNQTMATVRHTELPRKVMKIVRQFYQDTHSPIVKQALTVYTQHYVMTHHLTFTPDTIRDLASTGLIPQSNASTARLLGRQIKAVVDELLQEEIDKLFKMFGRELKPKARSSWAPCLAAFLVFCLVLEAIGLALDTFVVQNNNQDMQNGVPITRKRSEAVDRCRELENMPFRQFAYQFHNIYQTHQLAPTGSSSASSSVSSPSGSNNASSSSSTSSPASSNIKAAFNPLLDDGPLQSGDLDTPATKFVTSLRELLQGDSWSEMDFLSYAPALDAVDGYPMRDIAFDYEGRLLSKFLLSFENEGRIFTPV